MRRREPVLGFWTAIGAVRVEEPPHPSTIRSGTAGGTPFELRAIAEEGTVTIELRWPSRDRSDWEALRIGELVELLKPATGVSGWLQDLGVLWGAWIGRRPSEIARFTRSHDSLVASDRRVKGR